METNINQEKQVAQTIQYLIRNLRKDKHIVNEVIRDDVFAILRAECIVLFFPSKDSGVEGCHVINLSMEK